MSGRDGKLTDGQAPPSYYDSMFAAPQPSDPLFQPLPSPPPFVPSSITGIEVQASTSREVGVNSPKLGPDPIKLRCHHCGGRIKTETSIAYSRGTYACCCFLCLLCLPLAYLPFFMDAPKSVTHSCPNCNAMVGKYIS